MSTGALAFLLGLLQMRLLRLYTAEFALMHVFLHGEKSCRIPILHTAHFNILEIRTHLTTVIRVSEFQREGKPTLTGILTGIRKLEIYQGTDKKRKVRPSKRNAAMEIRNCLSILKHSQYKVSFGQGTGQNPCPCSFRSLL